MGNLLSCRAPEGSSGKVVLPDGTVHELDRPTPVAELMLEHPRHFVVDVRSLSPGRNSKAMPLPADHMLQPNKVYVMLPMARGKAAAGLSADEAHRVLAMATQSVLKLRSTSSLLRVLTGGRADKGNKVAAAAERKKEDLVDDWGTNMGGPEWSSSSSEGFEKSEHLMRQYSSKRWRPSLGTIVEKNLEKVPHWLF